MHAQMKLTSRTPWNKGKVISAKPPLRPSHVWSVRTKPQIKLISASGINRTSTVTARDKATRSAFVYERRTPTFRELCQEVRFHCAAHKSTEAAESEARNAS